LHPAPRRLPDELTDIKIPGFFHGSRLPDHGFWLTFCAAGKNPANSTNPRFAAFQASPLSDQFWITFEQRLEIVTMEFLLWIEASSIGVHVREDAWTFAVMLCLHSVGMAASLGVVMITTLSSLRALKGIPVLAHSGLFPAAWLGFGINLVSGVALYTSHATEYTFQWVFILKLSLLAVGGVLMKMMMTTYRAGGPEATGKLFGGLTLACWVGAIITGRLMAYS
jgi:hypothetical protein